MANFLSVRLSIGQIIIFPFSYINTKKNFLNHQIFKITTMYVQTVILSCLLLVGVQCYIVPNPNCGGSCSGGYCPYINNQCLTNPWVYISQPPPPPPQPQPIQATWSYGAQPFIAQYPPIPNCPGQVGCQRQPFIGQPIMG